MVSMLPLEKNKKCQPCNIKVCASHSVQVRLKILFESCIIFLKAPCVHFLKGFIGIKLN